MEQKDIMDALVQVRRMGSLLSETMTLTQELAEAIDRQDEISIRMLLGMRQEPITKLQLCDQAIRRQLNEFSAEDARRLRELLNGAEGSREEERQLALSAASNRKLLAEVRRLDEAINRKMARERSAYRKQ